MVENGNEIKIIDNTTDLMKPTKMWTKEFLALVKEVTAKNCTDEEFKLLVYTSKLYNLNPLRKEIYCIKYYNLNLLNELFGVICPNDFDMGNIGIDLSAPKILIWGISVIIKIPDNQLNCPHQRGHHETAQ